MVAVGLAHRQRQVRVEPGRINCELTGELELIERDAEHLERDRARRIHRNATRAHCEGIGAREFHRPDRHLTGRRNPCVRAGRQREFTQCLCLAGGVDLQSISCIDAKPERRGGIRAGRERDIQTAVNSVGANSHATRHVERKQGEVSERHLHRRIERHGQGLVQSQILGIVRDLKHVTAFEKQSCDIHRARHPETVDTSIIESDGRYDHARRRVTVNRHRIGKRAHAQVPITLHRDAGDTLSAVQIERQIHRRASPAEHQQSGRLETERIPVTQLDIHRSSQEDRHVLARGGKGEQRITRQRLAKRAETDAHGHTQGAGRDHFVGKGLILRGGVDRDQRPHRIIRRDAHPGNFDRIHRRAKLSPTVETRAGDMQVNAAAQLIQGEGFLACHLR